MNRIGLITFHDTLNYGSLLQTFSLYKAIESLNYDITLIDYKCDSICKRESTYTWSECLTWKDYIKCILYSKKLIKRKKKFWQFINQNMKVSKVFTREDIGQANDLFEIFMVGSDIVWGVEITKYDYTYMLDFANDKTKLAFSSSIGCKWEKKDEMEIQKYLEKFNDITVRETDAAEWVGNLIHREINVTCDPTMLWSGYFWRNYISLDYKPKGKYVLAYMATDDRKNVKDAIYYGRKNKLPVYYIAPSKIVLGAKAIYPESFQEWLTLLANAEVIFTASYHGLLFSLYFEKNFFYYNRGNKSRMISLGNELNIHHREGTDDNIQLDRLVDYPKVNEILNRKREDSWKRLTEMLKRCDLN